MGVMAGDTGQIWGDPRPPPVLHVSKKDSAVLGPDWLRAVTCAWGKMVAPDGGGRVGDAER